MAGILHILPSDFPWSSDPFCLGDSSEADDGDMAEYQAWFDRRAPNMFQVVGVDYPDAETVYYLVAKKDLPVPDEPEVAFP